MVLEWLNILDLDKKNVARLCALDVKGARQVVDLGKVHIQHIIGRVVVLYLAAGPIETFNLDGLPVLDGATEGNLRSAGCVS